jgi:hypothetical protein
MPGSIVESRTEVALERVRVTRDTGRARLVMAAWLMGFAGIVGVSLVGKSAKPGVPDLSAGLVAPSATTELAARSPTVTAPPDASQRALEPAPWDRSTLGDDGLVGGLVFPGD